MSFTRLTVVKVGGSLFDHPDLFPALRGWLSVWARPVLLVPGGGGAADTVRHWDQVHRLGETVAHEVALDSLQASLSLFRAQFPDAEIVTDLSCPLRNSLAILKVSRFGRRPDLPVGWQVTTDSLAAYAAAALNAKLVLLKSVSIPEPINWQQAADLGQVDTHFPAVVRQFGLSVEAVNFRSWLARYAEGDRRS